MCVAYGGMQLRVLLLLRNVLLHTGSTPPTEWGHFLILLKDGKDDFGFESGKLHPLPP